MAKGNQASLIAGLALDTVLLCAEAQKQLEASPAPAHRKLIQYLQYRSCAASATAACFNALTLAGAGSGDAARQEMGRANQSIAAARRASDAYDSSAPSTLNLDHRRTDEVCSAALHAVIGVPIANVVSHG